MIFSSVSLGEIVAAQQQTWFSLGPVAIPKLGVFLQPVGFLVFLVSAFAETNRLPFDLPEGESEIVAGYHLEYGSMKFAMFMMAEYVNMFAASGFIVSLFFGGWQLLPGMPTFLEILPVTGLALDIARVALEFLSFFLKVGFFMWFFVWVRWTIPRFRYDQLMDLGWRVMLPLSLVNLLATAALVAAGYV
jgi:NADH-quinone oxidoreductase subunit H